MKKKLLKKVVVLAMALMVMTPVLSFSLPALAAAGNTNIFWGNNAGASQSDVQNTLGLGNRDPRAIAASVINIILGFLGIVAVIIILLGGFKWMTGGGNEDKVGEAKKLIVAGVIGLVIIIASFAIATFVLNSLMTAVSNNG